VHRNTVRYRLRRAEQLTGLDLRRPEDRLLCELVLLAERVERRQPEAVVPAACPPTTRSICEPGP
jgi:hypothetical protein